MDKERLNQEEFEIKVAKREHLKTKNKGPFWLFLILIPVVLFISLIFLRANKNAVISSLFGHMPYEETSKDQLVEIQPDVFVHKDMYEDLLAMKRDAEKDGVFLVFLSGYRSIKLQKEIFFYLKSIRNQIASERARVSAPPGYSEHSTGFAIDIGDANDRTTDFEVAFEKTEAFKWLITNAAKYHFILSFDKDHHSVDYEPWHWRYEGSVEALRIFNPSTETN